MSSETIELRGHIIDSLILPKVLDEILTKGGQFKIGEIKIGEKRADQSYAKIEVSAETGETLDEIISACVSMAPRPGAESGTARAGPGGRCLSG